MLSKELNLKLLELLPEIKELYEDEVSWQEGDDTGSHIVFGNVWFPYIINNINDDSITKKNFEVIEKILNLHDEYADEAIMFSVLENLYYEDNILERIELFIGNMAKKIFAQFE